MDLPFKPIPLVLTSSMLASVPNESGIIKKRKLSECSDSSNSNSISEKSSFNEKFLGLSLDNQSKFPSSDEETIKIEEHLTAHTITIPKPMRRSGAGQTNSPKADAPAKNDRFFDSLIQMSQQDIPGISKYLNLDLDVKLHAWNKFTSNSNPTEKVKMSSIITSFMNSPFNLPFLRPDLLMSGSQEADGSHTESDQFPKKFSYQGNYIGPLNQEQRHDKISKYLEKKQNRKWKHVRYNVRKDLADQRERCQGRFVKANKNMSHSDFMEKHRTREGDGVIKNKSDFTFDTIRHSSENLGKRPSEIDLFHDTSTPM